MLQNSSDTAGSCCPDGSTGNSCKFDFGPSSSSSYCDYTKYAIPGGNGTTFASQNISSIAGCFLPLDVNVSDPCWSHSQHCNNFNYVQQTVTQTVTSVWFPIMVGVQCLLLPVGGAASDAFGRKPVLVAMLLLYATGCAVWACDARMVSQGTGSVDQNASLALLVGGLFGLQIGNQAGIWQAVCVPYVVDSVPPESVNKMLPLLAASAAIGVLGSQGASFLLNGLFLDDYTTWFFATAAAVGGAAVLLSILLPESLEPSKRSTGKLSFSAIMRDAVTGMKLLLRDPVLRLLPLTMGLWCFGYYGGLNMITPWLLNVVGLTQQTMFIPGIIGNTFFILATVLNSLVMPRVGAIGAQTLGFGIAVVGYLVMHYVTTASPKKSFVGPCIGSALVQSGMGFWIAAPGAIVSPRVQQEDMGKINAAVLIFGSVGALLGQFVYPYYLYDAGWTDFKANMFLDISAGVFLLAAILSCAMQSLDCRYAAATTTGSNESYDKEGKVIYQE